jgi:hypothetical protein
LVTQSYSPSWSAQYRSIVPLHVGLEQADDGLALAVGGGDPAGLLLVEEALVQEFAQSEGAKLGSVNQALRVAVTG